MSIQRGRADGFWSRTALRAVLMARRPFTAVLVRDGQVMDGGMATLAAMLDGPPSDLRALRAAYAQAPGLVGLRPAPEVSVRDGMAGGRPVRRYRPPGGGSGLIVYYHGGGFIMGGLDSHDALCRAVAARAGLAVVAVEYRLAPEQPFPAAVEDAVAAYRALRADWAGPVAVGGDSAGGNLAAIICQQCRDAPPVLQWLLYPVLDMLDEGYDSVALFADQFPLPREAIDQCGRLYLPAGQDVTDVRLSPIRGELAGLPPAIVVAAGFDLLRDQAGAYVVALRRAGVPAQLLTEPGLVHGFADFAGAVPEARRAVWRAIASLRGAMQGVAEGRAMMGEAA